MNPVLGVDGGNSKAIAVIAEHDGSIVAAARAGGSADIYAAGGEDAAVQRVLRAVDEALTQARISRADVEGAVFSMAGADWPEDIAYLAEAFGSAGLAAPRVVNDAIGALAGAVPDGPAVVVSIGSGAATGARGSDGSTWHSSFWQSPHGATDLAQQMLAAVVRSELGIDSAGVLRDRLLAITGDEDVEAALHRLTARGAVEWPVGQMVRGLLEAAERGDPVALRVVMTHGAGLGAVAAAAARRVGIAHTQFALSFCGGLARGRAPELIDAATDAVRQSGQTPISVAPRWEPAIGALVIGLTAGRPGPLRDAVAARLDATAPPASFYDTVG